MASNVTTKLTSMKNAFSVSQQIAVLKWMRETIKQQQHQDILILKKKTSKNRKHEV